MVTGFCTGLMQAGRAIRAEEVALIRETVELFPGLSRRELARTICDHLEWYTAAGTYKAEACEKLLGRLEAQGLIGLPERRQNPACGRRRAAPRTRGSDPGPELVGELGEIGRIGLEMVAERGERELWNEYVGRYHYLGYKPPFGCYLRYFIVSEKGRLGCVLLAGAAKAVGVRDRWIGWTRPQRLRNLGWVVNNVRFLVFPWVRVRHLASHALGQVGRRVAEDWQTRWGYRPVLLESFVDPAHYRGTCYRASGWELLGETTGEGKPRRGKRYQTTVKLVFVKPLTESFRTVLCSETLKGRPVEP